MEKHEAAREAILSAGDLISKRFAEGEKQGVELKGMNDFVTGVDRESEKIIKDILKRSFPGIPFLAEESSSKLDAEQFWVIDPLDGTTNFIHGYQQVGVSIALVKDAQTVLGMVLDPLRNELFEAMQGGGAFCNGEKIAVSDSSGLQGALVGTGFPFRAHRHLDRYLEIFREIFLLCGGMRRAGAAVLDLCHTAAGRLDGFWELYLKPWDMAAGGLIVKEAGGKVSDFFGAESYLASGNIIAGSAAVHEGILKIIRGKITRGEFDDLASDLIDD